MRQARRIARSDKIVPPAHVITRGNVRRPAVVLSPVAIHREQAASALDVLPLQSEAYVDYARVFTAEGGIRLDFKDIDTGLLHLIVRTIRWVGLTWLDAWLVFTRAPDTNVLLQVAAVPVLALVNYLVFGQPRQLKRSVEIRPDGMVIDGTDLFWLHMMEGGWPSFAPDEEGNLILSGIYGTRLVEYLTVRRFDELDRAPEVFASHLQDAMRQLWTLPS